MAPQKAPALRGSSDREPRRGRGRSPLRERCEELTEAPGRESRGGRGGSRSERDRPRRRERRKTPAVCNSAAAPEGAAVAEKEPLEERVAGKAAAAASGAAAAGAEIPLKLSPTCGY